MQTITDSEALLEDQLIMNGIAAGNPEALEKLHGKYRAVIKAVVMQVLHDDSEADDVLQDVLLQVWNRPDAYSEKKGKLISWICTLAKRRAIDRLRHHSAYRRATDRFEISCSMEASERGQNHLVENEAILDDLRGILQEHLHALPPAQEEVVRMAFLENRSQREIAAITHIPLGTVKTRIELGIKKLSHSLVGFEKDILN